MILYDAISNIINSYSIDKIPMLLFGHFFKWDTLLRFQIYIYKTECVCVCVCVCVSVCSTLQSLFFRLFLKFLCHLIEKLPGSVLVKTEFKYIL